MARKAKPQAGKSVEALRHARADATRKHIPTAEYQSVIEKEAQDPVRVPSSGEIATSIRNSSGAARTSKKGPAAM